MFTSHTQISPASSLVLKLKISEVSQKWIPKAVELKRIPTHKKCKCKKFCSQTRLVGEIYSSDVIMHRGYLCTFLFIETLVKKQSMPTSVYKSIILLSDLEFPLVTSVVLLTGKPPYWHDLPWRAKRSLSYGAHSWAPCGYCNENDARRWVEELFTTFKNFLVFLFIYLFIYL